MRRAAVVDKGESLVDIRQRRERERECATEHRQCPQVREQEPEAERRVDDQCRPVVAQSVHAKVFDGRGFVLSLRFICRAEQLWV